jgi:hypothetical protein
MSKTDIEWAVCGGDATDLFIGKQTKLHKDIDIAVLWESRKELIQYMIKINGECLSLRTDF